MDDDQEIETFCCPICFHNLAKRSATLAKLWVDLSLISDFPCFYYFPDNEKGDLEIELDLIRQLELLGYLLTTETKDGKHICVSLEGQYEGDVDTLICVNDHEEMPPEYREETHGK